MFYRFKIFPFKKTVNYNTMVAASDIFTLQSRIAREIAAELKATLTPSERALIERQPTQNQAAYELYLRALVQEEGLSTASRRDRFDQVVAIYEQAVASDPAFALAYARLAGVNAIDRKSVV